MLSADIAIVHKRRDPNASGAVSAQDVVGEVRGRTCLIVDDMIDTAGTIVEAVAALRARGATQVIIAATHAVLSYPARERLAGAAVDEVVVTDTLPVEAGPGITVVSIAELLGSAIRAVYRNESMTPLLI